MNLDMTWVEQKTYPFKFSFYGRWVYFEYIFSNISKYQVKSLVFIE